MNSALPNKINDYCGYVARAVKNYKETSYPDAAINCRKAAEAACKIIIHNAYNEKLAETKLNGKSLKELIILVKHEGLTERKTINTLETLQIIGNKAAHDNAIGKDETSYAIHALNLFTEYLFKEHLKISIPKTLDFIFAETKEKAIPPIIQKEIIEKIIVHEKFNKETEEELFSKIKDIELKSEGDSTKFEELKTELLLKIQELSQKKQIQPEEIKPIEKKSSLKKTGLLILISLIAISGAAFLLNYILKEKKNVKEENVFQLVKHPDSIYVAINSFQVLQDNPNIDYKIEQIIYNRINNLRLTNNLPINLIYTDYKGNNAENDTLIINKAIHAGFDLVYYGNLYETAMTDSNTLEINGATTIPGNRTLRSKKIKFKTVGDSTVIKEITDQGNMTVELYAFLHLNDKLNRQILSLMQGLRYYSLEQFNSVYNITATIKLNLKDYKGAFSDVEAILKKSPKDPFYLAYKASLFTYVNRLDSSKIYFDKSLKQDSSILNALTFYAGVCVSLKEYEKSEQLLQKAVKLAPKDYLPIAMLARLKMEKKEYDLAKSYALRANSMFKDDPANSVIIANVYGYVENKKDSAEFFYGQALGKDSMYADALNSLANYYLRFFVADPVYKQKANYLLNKAKAFKIQNDIKNDYGLGLTAFANGDYKTALSYFEKVYNSKYYDSDLFTGMAQAYFRTGQRDKALLLSKKAMEFDSLNPTNLAVYAYILSYVRAKDYKTVSYYFNKALIANNYPLDIYQQYGTYLYQSGKATDCIDLSLKAHKIFSTDTKINSLLAYAYTNQRDYKQGKPYFEFLITKMPFNDTLLCDYAQSILLNFQKADETYAYGLALIQRAIHINTDNPNYKVVFALYLLKGNRPDLAKEQYLKAKSLNNSVFNEELEKI